MGQDQRRPTSLERVRLVLSGGRPDRVPVDFMGVGCGLGLEAHRRFLAYAGRRSGDRGLGAPAGGSPARSRPQPVFVSQHPYPTVYDPILLERFGVDFRRVGLGSEACALSPRAGDAVRLDSPGPYALVARAPGPGPLGWCAERVGFERFLAMLGGPGVEALSLVGQATEAVTASYRRLLGETGPHVDLVELGDDYAYAGGPFFAPATFEAVFGPALAVVIGVIRELAPGAKVLFHSCGAVLDLVPALVAAGIDVLSPLDPSGRGMAPEVVADTANNLRTVRGERLVLHGGLAPHVLAGSREGIRQEVRHLVRVLGAGGGYILAPAGDVLEDVPPENLEAFFRIAVEEGDQS